jgi:cell volume regulation protein A
MAIGAVAGYAIARAGRMLILRVHLPAAGLYPAFTLALACLSFGLTTLLHGSGFLAVYVTGMTLGSGALPHAVGIRRVHDALGWLSQITMFLVLGLLSFPSRLLNVAGVGLALALFLAMVARPAVVALCLLPFRSYVKRDVAYVGWVGLRGAVPIILATFPVLSGAPGAKTVFDVVFFVVVVNAVLPGATVPWVTRRLGLVSTEPPPSPAVLEIESMQALVGELVSFHIDETLAPCGHALRDLPFPGGTSVVLVVRGRELVAPNGDTVLQPGDHAYVVTREEDRALLHLMFGRSEEG